MPEIAFLDTNMVVRYITGMPSEMATRAAQVIDHLDNLWVTPVVVAETAHVLMSVYQVPRVEVVDHLIAFMLKKNINSHAIDEELIIQGLLLGRPSGGVSVADVLIWAEARSAGTQVVYTFDEAFPSEGLEVRQ